MLGWERDLSGRLQRTTEESQPNMEDTEEFNSNNNRPRPPVQGQRTMRELLNPPRLSTLIHAQLGILIKNIYKSYDLILA